MLYKINASDVAGIIGKNQYKTKEDIFEQIAIEQGLVDFEESNLLHEVEQNLQEEISHVLATKDAVEIEERMKVCERKTENLIVEDMIRRTMSLDPIFSTPVKTPESIQTIVDTICTESNEPLKDAINDPRIKKFLKESKEVVESVKSINTIRGQKLEEISTDSYQSLAGTEVKSRNSRCYVYSKNKWLIAGRVDGLTSDSVVETKTRRRFWKAPPEYDIIQLRCYMKLCNKKIGILNEQFPNNTSRATRIEWDDTIWKSIEDSIDTSIAEFEKNYVH